MNQGRVLERKCDEAEELSIDLRVGMSLKWAENGEASAGPRRQKGDTNMPPPLLEL
jgi:hypothetical protein